MSSSDTHIPQVENRFRKKYPPKEFAEAVGGDEQEWVLSTRIHGCISHFASPSSLCIKTRSKYDFLISTVKGIHRLPSVWKSGLLHDCYADRHHNFRYTSNLCLDVASAWIIICTRRINLQSGERLVKKILRIREMYDFACLTDLDPLPALLKFQLTSEIPCGYWVEDPCGFISNYDRFSSRTPVWRGFLQVLYSSSLATADFMAHLYFGSSGDGYNLSPDFNQEGGPNAFAAIKKWPWCQKVHSETATSLIVRMGSLRSSLPFILGLYQNPPHGLVEDSFPPGSYMSTLVIRFKDFRFSVDLYRNYYSEPDSDFE